VKSIPKKLASERPARRRVRKRAGGDESRSREQGGQPSDAGERPRERLGEHELSFWRAVHLEGLPIRGMAARYLPGSGDSRRAFSDISHRLARAARLAGAKRIPAPFEKPPPAIDAAPAGAIDAPTLEDFRAEYPDDFPTERELQALFLSKYPPKRKHPSARARFIRQAARAPAHRPGVTRLYEHANRCKRWAISRSIDRFKLK